MKDDFGFTDMASGAAADGYIPPDRTPHGVMGKMIDLVSRGQYASAAMVDSILSDDGMAFAGAMKLGMSELIAPDRRMSYTDIIKKHAPGFAEKNRKTTAGPQRSSDSLAMSRSTPPPT
jgi:hypothetical protein